jgi:hypothetical protein
VGPFITCYGDAGYDHEGYAAQVLDDGTLTGNYSDETEARMVGQVVAACGCGWTGATRYSCPEPFDEAAEDLALAEWEQSHARPVLEQGQRVDLERLRVLARRVAADLPDTTGDDAPRSARQLADQLDRVVAALETASALARRLSDQAHEQAAREQATRRGGPVMTDDRDLLDAIAASVPYDGPHDADTVVDAAHGLRALVRYLNNATGPGNARTTLAWAATTHRVLGGIGAAAHGLDQLLVQLADAMTRQASDPTLYDDRRDRPGAPTARAVAAQLAELRPAAGDLARRIDQARELSVHLGNEGGAR